VGRDRESRQLSGGKNGGGESQRCGDDRPLPKNRAVVEESWSPEGVAWPPSKEKRRVSEGYANAVTGRVGNKAERSPVVGK